MAENSKIEWTDSTGGPWLGCTEISPGCLHCYARELMSRRLFVIVRKAYKAAGFEDWETRPVWGDKAPRVVTRGFWDTAKTLNRKAAKDGERRKMFPSMIDWLDECPAGMIDQEGKWVNPIQILADFLKLIHDTPNLDWLLLSKRPENWADRIREARNFLTKGGCAETALWLNDWLPTPATSGIHQRGRQATTDHPAMPGDPPANVWIGVTCEDQKRADERIPLLLKIPAKVRFLSVEPMLENINLKLNHPLPRELQGGTNGGINWVICGGESGSKKRAFDCDWARSIRDQCKAVEVKFFFKQVDKVQPIPSDLMIREFPEAGR